MLFWFCINSGVYLRCSWCTVLPQKRHTISEGAQYKKTIFKLAAFLVTGNVLIVTGQIVLFAVNLWVIIFESIDGIYLSYTLRILSFTPTPILIAVFLKPVQRGLHHLFCCKHFKGDETIGTIPEIATYCVTARVDYVKNVDSEVCGKHAVSYFGVFGRIKSLSVYRSISMLTGKFFLHKHFVPPQEVASLSQQGRIATAQHTCAVFSIE